MKCGLVALQEPSQLPIWPRISEMLRRGCGDGQVKCPGQGAQPRPLWGHCRNTGAQEGARDGWPQGTAALLGSEDAAKEGKSRKRNFRKVLVCRQREKKLTSGCLILAKSQASKFVSFCSGAAITCPDLTWLVWVFVKLLPELQKLNSRLTRVLLQLLLSHYGT